MNSRTRPSGPGVQETASIKNAISRILRHAREAAPAATAALASGLLCPLALGAPGDLDPSFGDVGRTGLMVDFAGPAWSVEPVDDGQVIFAGGEDNTCYSDYYCGDVDTPSFLGRLSSTGAIDPGFTAARLDGTVVLDTAVQPDGKVVCVGQKVRPEGFFGSTAELTVFRLARDGALDPTFGTNGIAQFPEQRSGSGHSLALDPDGRVVVAGSRGGTLIVLRLLANGALDHSFGEGGVVSDTATEVAGTRAHDPADGQWWVSHRDERLHQQRAPDMPGARLDGGR